MTAKQITRQRPLLRNSFLEPLLGSDLRAMMEVLLEECLLGGSLRDYISQKIELS
jgi:hypothetical protein